mmetsp:Transcript_164295/g.399342  ORF Transcript_164295/g.399342 Transcript_164295/m.399342 type:complete len:694 (-) Transcript_164295:286-2367(-)
MPCLRQLRLLWSDWPGHEAGLHFWTLRFNSPGLEDGFLKSRKASLARRVRMISSAAVLIALIIVFTGKLVFVDECVGDCRGFNEKMVTTRVRLGGLGAVFVVSILLLAMLQCQSLGVELSPAILELAVSFYACIWMCAYVLTEPIYVSKVLGHNITEVHGEDAYIVVTDSAILLTIAAVVTATHLGLPIRWHVICITEFVGIFLYAFIFFRIGSVEARARVNLTTLMALIMMSALGKRTLEVMERKAFFQVLNERSLRCQAEFQRSSREDRTQDAPGSICESLPTTTATGRVFGSLRAEDADPKKVLQQVQLIGDREHWHIKSQEVKLLPDQILGSGGFGVVLKGIFCGAPVAVKVSRIKLDGTVVKRLADMCDELRVIRRLRHPSIVAVNGAIIDPENLRLALVMEQVQGVQLETFVNASKERTSEMPDLVVAQYQVIIGVCCAIIFLHTRDPAIVHGDLKASNIMVEYSSNRGAQPRLLDFGLSRVLTPGARPLGGTPIWKAPEIWNHSPPQCSADIYSLGHVIVFVATGNKPLCGLTLQQIKDCMQRGTPPTPVWPSECIFERTCKALVRRCLDVNPGNRPSAQVVHEEILGHLATSGLNVRRASLLDEQLKALHWSQAVADRRLAGELHTEQTTGNQIGPVNNVGSPPQLTEVCAVDVGNLDEQSTTEAAVVTEYESFPTSKLATARSL